MSSRAPPEKEKPAAPGGARAGSGTSTDRPKSTRSREDINHPVLWVRDLRDRALRVADKSVLGLALAARVDAGAPPPWRCFASYETIARDSGISSLDTVREALKRLQHLGYILDTGERKGRAHNVVVWEILRDNPAREQRLMLAYLVPKRVVKRSENSGRFVGVVARLNRHRKLGQMPPKTRRGSTREVEPQSLRSGDRSTPELETGEAGAGQPDFAAIEEAEILEPFEAD